MSLSFLVDELDIRRGGIAANICFGMGSIGKESILVGSVGDDFADYRSWLERHAVDTASVRVSDVHHTARFLCTTDQDQNQIATFYSGAMSEARNIELKPVADRVGGLDLVVISPNDPDAMLRHTDECRTRAIPFVADPSQQLARMDGADVRRLIDGAAYLFTNEYEKALCEEKTGWSGAEILSRVGIRVTTLGAKGVVIDRAGEEGVHVPASRSRTSSTRPASATPSAASCRPPRGTCRWSAPRRSAAPSPRTRWSPRARRSTLARQTFLDRFGAAYGADAAAEIAGHITCPNP